MNEQSIRRPARALIAALAVMLPLLSGCGQQSTGQPQAKKPAREKSHLVEVANVQRSTLSQARTYTGSLRARRVVRIHALEEGRIIALPLFEGDAVTRGQVILELDRELLSTELDKTEALHREAEANLARLRRLASQQLIARDELLRSETAVDVSRAEASLLRTRVGYTQVVAPFDALVTERLAEPGDILKRHDHVLTLADPDSLVADLNVSELIMPFLNIGDSAQVRIDALGDASFAGTIQRIHPNLDPASRQGRVEVRLDAARPGVRAGQFARVSFQVQALNRKLAPFSAVRRDSDGEYVFRVDQNDKVHLVRVRTGARLAERVELLEGVNEGDRIISKGFLGLKSGMKVKVVRARTGNAAGEPASRGDPAADSMANNTRRPQQ